MTATDGDARLRCVRCGMVATADPWFHAERYDHQPVVTVNGTTYRHDGVMWVPDEDTDR